LFSFKTNFFFAKTRDGFEGVQRRGPVKGAVCPRSSKTLDGEHRWNNASFGRRGLREEKMEKKRLRLRTPNGWVFKAHSDVLSAILPANERI
jgi:hypothetical protein